MSYTQHSDNFSQHSQHSILLTSIVIFLTTVVVFLASILIVLAIILMVLVGTLSFSDPNGYSSVNRLDRHSVNVTVEVNYFFIYVS